jgi:hypothetical protein
VPAQHVDPLRGTLQVVLNEEASSRRETKGNRIDCSTTARPRISRSNPIGVFIAWLQQQSQAAGLLPAAL